MIARLALGALAALGCKREAAPVAPPLAPPKVADAAPAPTPAVEHRVGDERVTLSVEAGRCALARGADRLRLDLAPPCHVPTWKSTPPPRAGAPSDGVSVGGVGDAIAWRYPSAGGVLVAIIGDEVPESLRGGLAWQTRQQQGFRCGGSLQGVLLTAEGLRAAKKRTGAIHCAEVGLDEKELWLLAH